MIYGILGNNQKNTEAEIRDEKIQGQNLQHDMQVPE